jgi:hypothetical protein
LAVQLVALRQRQRCIPFDCRAIDRDTKAIWIDDCHDVRLVLEWRQLPNLAIAAIALGDDDRIAGAGRLVGGPRQSVEAKPANGQVAAVLESERLARSCGAARNCQALAGSKVRSRHIDAPIGISGGKNGLEGVVVVGTRRNAGQPEHQRGHQHRRPETGADFCLGLARLLTVRGPHICFE